MMAKVEQEAMSNPWLPIVAAVGGAAQSFVGNAGMYTKGAGGLKGNAGSILDKAIPKLEASAATLPPPGAGLFDDTSSIKSFTVKSINFILSP